MKISRDTFSGIKLGYLDKCLYKITLNSPDAIKDPNLSDVFLWGINNIGRVEVECGEYSKPVMNAAYSIAELFEEEQDRNSLIDDMQSSGPILTLKNWWNPFSGKLVKIIFDELKFDEFNEAFVDVNKNEAKITIFDNAVIYNEKFISKLSGLIASLDEVSIDFAMLGEEVAKELTSHSYVKKLKKYDACEFSTLYFNNNGDCGVSYKRRGGLENRTNNSYINDNGLDLEELDRNYKSTLYNLAVEDSLTIQDSKEIYEKLIKGISVDVLMKDESNVLRSAGIRFERTNNGEINILTIETSPYFSEEDISKNIIQPFIYLSLTNGINNIGLGVKDLITNNVVIEVEILKSRVVKNRVDFHFGEDMSTFYEGVFSFALSGLVSDLINEYNSVGLHVYDSSVVDYKELESEISERIHPVAKYNFQYAKDSSNKEYLLIVT